MFFRRERQKIPSFADRVELLKQAGFCAEALADGRVKVAKHGIGAIVRDGANNEPAIDKAGVLVGSSIAVLLNAGYQMFLELPNGARLPATADQLQNLHQFEDDLKEALGLANLYNTSLGTVSRKHLYDRVRKPSLAKIPV